MMIETDRSHSVVLAYVTHVRMPLSEGSTASVVVRPQMADDGRVLHVVVGPDVAEALLSVLRGGPAPVALGGRLAWVMTRLSRASVGVGQQRLALRLGSGPDGAPRVTLTVDSLDAPAMPEVSLALADGLLASLRLRIPLLVDTCLLEIGALGGYPLVTCGADDRPDGAVRRRVNPA